MLETQKSYATYLSKAAETVAPHIPEPDQVLKLRELMLGVELMVPVVGAYSAGKSTMLNMLLGRSVLPVGLAPETDLGSELRYGVDERIEAVKVNGDFETFGLDEYDGIKSRASEFNHLRLYVKSPVLQELQPLVLVDMPGFDSSLENHNKAIGRYIERGSHYIVLISAEEGGLTKSVQSYLTDINTLGKRFSFFVSKANLRAEPDLAEIVSNIQDQIDVLYGEGSAVLTLGNEDASQVKRRLDDLEPERIFTDIYERSVKDCHLDLVDGLNLAIAGMQREAAESEDAVHEMKQAMERVIARRDKVVRDVKERYSEASVDRCSRAVESALINAADELTDIALSSGNEALTRRMSDISRSVLLQEVRREIRDINSAVVDDLSVELRSSENSLPSLLQLDGEWLSDFSDRLKQGINHVGGALTAWSRNVRSEDKASSEDKARTVYKALATTVAVTTSIVTPLIELLIIFLPELLSGFMKNKHKAEVRTKVVTQIVPDVTREVSNKLSEFFDEQVAEAVKNVSEQFEQKLHERAQMLEKVVEDKKESQSAIESKIAELEEVRSGLQTIAAQHLYRGM